LLARVGGPWAGSHLTPRDGPIEEKEGEVRKLRHSGHGTPFVQPKQSLGAVERADAVAALMRWYGASKAAEASPAVVKVLLAPAAVLLLLEALEVRVAAKASPAEIPKGVPS